MTTQNINMDLIPGGNSKVIRVSQYDHESRTYKITLTHNNKNDFTIPEYTRIEVRGTKPSGKSFVYPCDFNGNVVTLVIKDQMTAEYGTVKAELVLVKGTTRLGSGNFEIIVEKASFTPDNVTNSDTFDSLVEDAVVKCANENLIELHVDVELNAESDAPVANKVICNNFANAIKGYVSGLTVTADDVSPVKHTPIVNVHGKNLLNPVGKSKTQNGITFTNNGDGTFTVSGTSTATLAVDLTDTVTYPIELKKGKTYTQSVEILDGEGATHHIVPSVSDENGLVTYNYFNGNQTKTPDKNYKIKSYSFYIGTNITVDFTFRVQLEESDTATEYAPYIDPTTVIVTDGDGKTYIPNTAGIVEGVVSTSPSMKLSTNNADFVIECEYIRDSTKVIEKLTNAIIALGGSV